MYLAAEGHEEQKFSCMLKSIQLNIIQNISSNLILGQTNTILLEVCALTMLGETVFAYQPRATKEQNAKQRQNAC